MDCFRTGALRVGRICFENGAAYFIILIFCIGFAVIKRMLYKLISSTTSPPEINMAELSITPADNEEEDPKNMVPPEGDDIIPFEDWPTNQDWFGDLYPNLEYLKPQIQFSAS